MTRDQLDNLRKNFEIAGALCAAEGVGAWSMAIGADPNETPIQVLERAHTMFLEQERERQAWREARLAPPPWETLEKEAKG